MADSARLSPLAEIYAWTNSAGQTIQARFIHLKDGAVRFGLLDGTDCDFALDQLDCASQEQARKLAEGLAYRHCPHCGYLVSLSAAVCAGCKGCINQAPAREPLSPELANRHLFAWFLSAIGALLLYLQHRVVVRLEAPHGNVFHYLGALFLASVAIVTFVLGARAALKVLRGGASGATSVAAAILMFLDFVAAVTAAALAMKSC